MAEFTGATVLDATPATYRSILNIAAKHPTAKDSLRTARMLCSGAAPLDPQLRLRYEAEFGRPLLDSYGSTELGNNTFATIENPTACGQVMPGLDLKVVDDAGMPVATGEVGYLDEGRNLFVLGRKQAVNRSGYTLYPEVVERKAAQHGCSAKVIALPGSSPTGYMCWIASR
jgi:long-chain acyl-CoA synthetase